VDPDRSFERIYRRHRREVYGSVLRDVRDPDEAEDVTQVAFLNAYRAMRRGDRPEKPRAWLITIARNVVRRRARSRAGRPQEVELDDELLVTLDDTEGSASDDICAALRGLTESQREAILLREIQGQTYGEIAQELGISVAAVEALLFRARRALAEELALVDRAPVVRPEKRHGLLALPGLAKLGSFGFSFGRASVACLVGCAVIATVPIRDGDASRERTPPAQALVRGEPASPRTAVASEAAARPRRVDGKPAKRRHPHGTKHSNGHASSPATHEDSQPAGSSPVTVALPPVQVPPVELPPVETPPVQIQVPPVQVPPLPQPDIGVQPPPLPDLPGVPPPSSLTS
jgi:RNA polymerase sigma-70 factor (ECF subfamily)